MDEEFKLYQRNVEDIKQDIHSIEADIKDMRREFKGEFGGIFEKLELNGNRVTALETIQTVEKTQERNRMILFGSLLTLVFGAIMTLVRLYFG